MTADAVVTRFRRDLTLAWMLRNGLLVMVVAWVMLSGAMGWDVDPMVSISVFLVVWMVLVYRSRRATIVAASASNLIASGQFDAAEKQLDFALRSFSVLTTGKLIGLHHLARLRHAQHNWRDAALLCQTLLSQRLGRLQQLSQPSRLMLADSMLCMGDVKGAYAAMADLYDVRLPLGELLALQLLQLDYMARISAWAAMLQNVASRIQLSELMPPAKSAKAQALLAMAADKGGRTDLRDWLLARASRLADRQAIVSDQPLLATWYV